MSIFLITRFLDTQLRMRRISRSFCHVVIIQFLLCFRHGNIPVTRLKKVSSSKEWWKGN